MKRRHCLKCRQQVYYRTRGLCERCYWRFRGLVTAGLIGWENLEQQGRTLPAKRKGVKA